MHARGSALRTGGGAPRARGRVPEPGAWLLGVAAGDTIQVPFYDTTIWETIVVGDAHSGLRAEAWTPLAPNRQLNRPLSCSEDDTFTQGLNPCMVYYRSNNSRSVYPGLGRKELRLRREGQVFIIYTCRS